MNSILSVIRLLAVLIVFNFISIALLVILKFNEWDIAATVVTCTFSIAIILIELSKGWGYTLRPWFSPILAAGVVIGGVSGFFWFFHLIHKLAHYQGDFEDTFWTSVTIILTFVLSMYLVITAYRTSKYTLVESRESVKDDVEGPLTITDWAQQYFSSNQDKRTVHEIVHAV